MADIAPFSGTLANCDKGSTASTPTTPSVAGMIVCNF